MKIKLLSFLTQKHGRVPATMRDHLLEGFIALLLLALWTLSWYFWKTTSNAQMLPIRFDMTGQPEEYASRIFYLQTAGVISLGALAHLLSAYRPQIQKGWGARLSVKRLQKTALLMRLLAICIALIGFGVILMLRTAGNLWLLTISVLAYFVLLLGYYISGIIMKD